MEYLDILNQLKESINWIVFAIVIAIGYFVRVTPIYPSKSTTFKIVVISFFAVVPYVFFSKSDIAQSIASYFIAFGMHSAIIKLIERKLFPNSNFSRNANTENSSSQIVGPRPGDRG